MKYFKCVDCWRVYDEWQLIESPIEQCVCGSKRFKGSSNLRLRRFFTDMKYIIFGEKVYDKRC
jgi:DNA-directed RNA polymerase subunit RPC12/RpoP